MQMFSRKTAVSFTIRAIRS